MAAFSWYLLSQIFHRVLIKPAVSSVLWRLPENLKKKDKITAKHISCYWSLGPWMFCINMNLVNSINSGNRYFFDFLLIFQAVLKHPSAYSHISGFILSLRQSVSVDLNNFLLMDLILVVLPVSFYGSHILLTSVAFLLG